MESGWHKSAIFSDPADEMFVCGGRSRDCSCLHRCPLEPLDSLNLLPLVEGMSICMGDCVAISGSCNGYMIGYANGR